MILIIAHWGPIPLLTLNAIDSRELFLRCTPPDNVEIFVAFQILPITLSELGCFCRSLPDT